ncbi:MAG: hypothetical protein FJX74_00490 [Armatimonadetes bacterium]|nr:hypothetical protein [Armatimonadota bacterium]
MGRCTVAHVLTFLLAGGAWSATYKVTTNANAGVGSFRWAINRANSHAGPDAITFEAALGSQTIAPTSALPDIVDADTSILGDTDVDGLPDILLRGLEAGAANGLTLKADRCTVDGLAIMDFSGNGILLWRADECVIRNCHVGVNRGGGQMYRNGVHQIKLWGAHRNTIGREVSGGRNVIAAGSAAGMRSGVYVANSIGNAIKNNNIGVARDGITPLCDMSEGGVGITLITPAALLPAQAGSDRTGEVVWTGDNLIGGRVGDRNVIGGMQVGIDLCDADENLTSANYLGLGRGGTTSVPLGDAVRIRGGSRGNRIGPLNSDPERGNIIWGDLMGVSIYDEGTEGNTVDGNHFTRRIVGKQVGGILCRDGAGSQILERNSFGGDYSPYTHSTGVYLSDGGQGSRIADNQFLRSVVHGLCVWGGVEGGLGAQVIGNGFTGNSVGIECLKALPSLKVQDNAFRGCWAAVRIYGLSAPLLGRQFGSGEDLGRNRFYFSNQWYIMNLSPNRIMAEGNRFPGGFLDPHVKILDAQDDSSRGVVDIEPQGSPLPTLSSAGALALSGTTALLAGTGAEIAFTLSAPAEVEVAVLNLAGRPVATVCRAREYSAGTQRLYWDGRGDSGLRVPAGRYVVQVGARGPDGAQARALATVLIGR